MIQSKVIVIFFLFMNVAFGMAQDTLYVYKAGNVDFRQTIDQVDSIKFNNTLNALPDSLYILNADVITYKNKITNIDSITFKQEIINTVRDVDGNEYHTVMIGNNIWLVENLRTTHYRNGDMIGTTIPATEKISNQTMPTYQWPYNGDENNAVIYGRLYTWYAATDARNIAPVGWHVATDDEWNDLHNYVIANGFNYDGTKVDNKIAKSLASTTLWGTTTVAGSVGNNLNLNNASGFTAVPGGSRDAGGLFLGDLNYFAHWWTSSGFSAQNAWGRSIGFDYVHLNRFNYDKKSAWSVRCVKDK